LVVWSRKELRLEGGKQQRRFHVQRSTVAAHGQFMINQWWTRKVASDKSRAILGCLWTTRHSYVRQKDFQGERDCHAFLTKDCTFGLSRHAFANFSASVTGSRSS
jgi:hypothetical protein